MRQIKNDLPFELDTCRDFLAIYCCEYSDSKSETSKYAHFFEKIPVQGEMLLLHGFGKFRWFFSRRILISHINVTISMLISFTTIYLENSRKHSHSS